MVFSTEREKLSSLVSERQREVLAKSTREHIEHTERGRRQDDARGPGDETCAEAEAVAPTVGRWGAEWPSWLAADSLNPLPDPRWGSPRAPLHLTNAEHEDLVTRAEGVLRRLLLTDNYDSVSNFISLYDAFEMSAEPLQQLFGKYTPPIVPGRHTCVGLGIELLRRWRSLDKWRPGFAAACALVSCEEAVEDVREYVSGGEGPEAVLAAEKEHVMVCVQIVLDGRAGILLADPGYHVPRVVTVMADRGYPHTGQFP